MSTIPVVALYRQCGEHLLSQKVLPPIGKRGGWGLLLSYTPAPQTAQPNSISLFLTFSKGNKSLQTWNFQGDFLCSHHEFNNSIH